MPILPPLFAGYFVLALLGLNITQVRPEAALRALLIVMVASILVWLLLRWLLDDGQRAGVIVTLLLGVFFIYGHIYNFLEQVLPSMGRHRVLLPVWLAMAGIGLWWTWRKLRNPQAAARLLTWTGVALLIFPAYQIISWEVRTAGGQELVLSELSSLEGMTAPEAAPDIYFIILDEYTRQDVLSETFGYDNDVFLEELRGMGFQVVDCAQSNYAQTEMVLSSVLNMNYLEELGDYPPDSTDRAGLRQLIKNSLVEQTLRSLGYHLVAFETGFYFSELEDADVYLSPDNLGYLGGLNAFEVLLLRSTLGLALSDLTRVLPDVISAGQEQLNAEKRSQVLYNLDMLARIPQDIRGPKLVFAHILLPHPPFVFDEFGAAANYPENVSGEEYAAAYRAQIIFLNTRLAPMLRSIIDDSDTLPVIILQGDTGPGQVSHAGRMAILSALYLPGYEQTLPVDLTPVNDFRLVFDQYFKSSLGFLPDRSSFSLYTAPFDFEPIQNECRP